MAVAAAALELTQLSVVEVVEREAQLVHLLAGASVLGMGEVGRERRKMVFQLQEVEDLESLEMEAMGLELICCLEGAAAVDVPQRPVFRELRG